MTYRELYKYSENELAEAGNVSQKTDTCELMYHFFGVDRFSMMELAKKNAGSEQEALFLSAVQKRKNGYPLQYLLQQWSFMGVLLSVGEGVLIPRDDTEVCVRECMKLMDEKGMKDPIIIDLCSGSGAIAIALGKKYPRANITAAELSGEAFALLKENIVLNEVQQIIEPTQSDIAVLCREYDNDYFDVIISNPPYVRSEEIPALQKEVQYEPKMALDGGIDGLYFYRIIAEKWIPKLKKGGVVSLEIGEEQGQEVRNLLEQYGLKDVRVVKDIAGLDRTIIGCAV